MFFFFYSVKTTTTFTWQNFSFLMVSSCITASLSIWNGTNDVKICTEYKIRSLKHNYVDGTDFIGGIIQFSCCDQDRWLTTAFNQYPSFIIERLSRVCDNSFMVDCLCLKINDQCGSLPSDNKSSLIGWFCWMWTWFKFCE